MPALQPTCRAPTALFRCDAVLAEVIFFGLPDGEGSEQDQALPSLLARLAQLSVKGQPAPAEAGLQGGCLWCFCSLVLLVSV